MTTPRSLQELLPEVVASIDATQQRQLLQVVPAALRICAYLVRYRPGYLNELVEADKIELEDFITLLGYNGISSEPYEG
jgi:hypothetical protein